MIKQGSLLRENKKALEKMGYGQNVLQDASNESKRSKKPPFCKVSLPLTKGLMFNTLCAQ